MIKTKNKKDKWIKLICGASNEDIVAIEDLCAIYTAAGVNYIDVAAEESIVNAAKRGPISQMNLGSDESVGRIVCAPTLAPITNVPIHPKTHRT